MKDLIHVINIWQTIFNKFKSVTQFVVLNDFLAALSTCYFVLLPLEYSLFLSPSLAHSLTELRGMSANNICRTRCHNKKTGSYLTANWTDITMYYKYTA